MALQSFGGPAGQIAVMHRILVEEKRWIGEERFLHALSWCMLLPGPEAQQLATYLGWLLHRTPGGLAAGILFVLPGFVAILALSLAYAAWGTLPFVAGIFFGIKPAVLALVLEALLRIARRALGGVAQWAIAAAAFAAIFLLGVPFPLIVLGAGLCRPGGRAPRAAELSRAAPAGRGRLRVRRPAAAARPRAARARDALAASLRARRRAVSDALARAGRLALLRPRSGRRLHPDRGLLLEARRGDLRRRLRGARLHGAAGGRGLRLALAARDARRPRHGRDDAGAADPGRAVRRLPGRVAQPRRAAALGRGRRWRPCSPPGSPTCPASCGSSPARPTSSGCAGAARCAARSRASPRRWSA